MITCSRMLDVKEKMYFSLDVSIHFAEKDSSYEI